VADMNYPEKQKAELLKMLDEEQPYEKKKFDEKMKAGSAREWAQLQEDGSIAVDIAQWLPDGTYSHGRSSSVPGDADYESLQANHMLKTSGDASTIILKWIDGSWVMDTLE
jgi:hypothetical protein